MDRAENLVGRWRILFSNVQFLFPVASLSRRCLTLELESEERRVGKREQLPRLRSETRVMTLRMDHLLIWNCWWQYVYCGTAED